MPAQNFGYNSTIRAAGKGLSFIYTPPFNASGGSFFGTIVLGGNSTSFNVFQRGSGSTLSHNIQISDTQYVTTVGTGNLPANVNKYANGNSLLFTTVKDIVSVYLVTDNTVLATNSTVDLTANTGGIYICFAGSSQFWTVSNGALTLGTGTTFLFDTPGVINTTSVINGSGSASSITISPNNTNSPFYIPFTTGQTGPQQLYGNNNIRTNPEIGSILVNRIGFANNPLTNSNSIAIGPNALDNGLGTNNIAIGASTLQSIFAIENNNVVIGHSACTTAGLCFNNVVVGTLAANNTTSLSNSIIIGANANSASSNTLDNTILLGISSIINSNEIRVGTATNTACYIPPVLVNNAVVVTYNSSSTLAPGDLIAPSGGVIYSTGNGVNITFTLPDASAITNILAGLAVGNTFQFTIINNNTALIQLAQSADGSFTVNALADLSAATRTTLTVVCTAAYPSPPAFVLY